jgi:hypothetical protein
VSVVGHALPLFTLRLHEISPLIGYGAFGHILDRFHIVAKMTKPSTKSALENRAAWRAKAGHRY